MKFAINIVTANFCLHVFFCWKLVGHSDVVILRDNNRHTEILFTIAYTYLTLSVPIFCEVAAEGSGVWRTVVAVVVTPVCLLLLCILIHIINKFFLSLLSDVYDRGYGRIPTQQCRISTNLNQLVLEPNMSNIYISKYFQTSTTEDVDESPHDIMEKRDHMLENMLVLLNSAAALGLGPTPGELRKDRTERILRTKSVSPMAGQRQGY